MRVKSKSTAYFIKPWVEKLEDRVTPSVDAFNANGIDARGLMLTGNNVPIGQFELGRPGKPGANNDNNLSHPDVTPTGVFLGQNNAAANGSEIRRSDYHATKVAGT